ncbi:MAG TPA: F0F1 ATP synthase subunit delta [Candidatus Omnitrophota bacterium]|jgi:F0F1-type ATP synthase delta subunit|nr:F0F1 ATP synthase subunit delta [Candidatus Omnitrophota bacterium]
MSLVMWVLLGQLAVGLVVLVALAFALNNMLADMAVRYIELWRPDEDEDQPAVRSIRVTSHRPLSADYHERIRKALSKNFSSELKISFSQDPKILGGVIVQMDEKVMDCSLRDRIQRAFGS